MLKIIALVILVILVAAVGFVAYAATRPDTFQVRRQIDIKAPPGKIFPRISNLGAWKDWSAYETKDPDMERSFSGPASGPGAVYAWNGDKNIGQGRMEILAVEPGRRVEIKLNFLRPFKSESMAEFLLEPMDAPLGDTTRVTWTMSGPAPLLSKIMGVVFNLDKMIGTDFEVGLANLKRLAEG